MSKIYKNKSFILFFFADALSSFAVGLGAISVNWYILAETKSARYVGMLFTINVFSGLLVSPYIGYLIDRMQRKWLLFGSLLFRGGGLLLIYFLFNRNHFSLSLMIAYTVVNGTAWAAYQAVSKTFLQEILEKEQLSAGNSIIEVSMQVGMFSVGAVSGLLYSITDFQFILLLSSLLFILSSLFTLFQKRTEKLSLKQDQLPFFDSFQKGMNYVKSHLIILSLCLLSMIPLVVTMLYNIVLPSYITDVVAGSSIIFGLADMFYGVGGFVSGIVLAVYFIRIRQWRFIIILYTSAVFVLFLLGVSRSVPLLFSGSFLLGFTNSGLRILMNTLLMKKIDPVYMGRVMSVYTAVSLILQMIGSYTIGLVIDFSNAGVGFLVLSCLMISGLVIVLTMNRNKIGAE